MANSGGGDAGAGKAMYGRVCTEHKAIPSTNHAADLTL